jgi:hypothetical protein
MCTHTGRSCYGVRVNISKCFVYLSNVNDHFETFCIIPSVSLMCWAVTHFYERLSNDGSACVPFESYHHFSYFFINYSMKCHSKLVYHKFVFVPTFLYWETPIIWPKTPTTSTCTQSHNIYQRLKFRMKVENLTADALYWRECHLSLCRNIRI